MSLSATPLSSSPQLLAAARNSPSLGIGARGAGVAILQRVLFDLGYPLPISIGNREHPDGVYGGETLGAVREFQRQHNLKPDGVAGALTLGKLNEIIAAGWFAQQLYLAADLAYQLDQTLARLLQQGTADVVSSLQRASHPLKQVLARYGKRPSPAHFRFAADGEGDVAKAGAQAIPLAALLLLGVAVVAAQIQAIAISQTKRKPPRLPDFPAPDMSDIGVADAVVIATAAAAVIVLKTAMEKLIAEAREIGKRLRDCLAQAKSPQCEAAVKLVMQLQSTLLNKAILILNQFGLSSRPTYVRLFKDALAKLQEDLRFLQENLEGLSRSGCCPGIQGK